MPKQCKPSARVNRQELKAHLHGFNHGGEQAGQMAGPFNGIETSSIDQHRL